MFEGFKEHLVSCEVDIHARVGGQGPAVLLLHGFPQNLFEWARVAPLLAEHYTVVCTDLRGYGKSGKPAAEGDAYSFRAMARDQVAVMNALGFDRFHVVGHDRGARTAHRLTLDHPKAVLSLSLLDIVPTLEMFANANAEVARAYWHWFFLQQPSPYPEKLIEASPDHFYEGFLSTLGNMLLGDFDQAQLEAYRCAWRDPDFIRASCADYRTTASIDCALDQQDLMRKVDCPSLVLWGAAGVLAQRFDVRSLWAKRLAQAEFATVNGGHFFVDQLPLQTAEILGRFLDKNSTGDSLVAPPGLPALEARS